MPSISDKCRIYWSHTWILPCKSYHFECHKSQVTTCEQGKWQHFFLITLWNYLFSTEGKRDSIWHFNLKQLIINVITNLNKIRSCRFIWGLNQWNVSTHVTCFLLSRLQLSWATPNLPRLCKHWWQKSRKFFRCYFGINDIFTNTFWNRLTFN